MTIVDLNSKRALYVLVVFILSAVSLYSLGFVDINLVEQMKLNLIYKIVVVVASIIGIILMKKMGEKKQI